MKTHYPYQYPFTRPLSAARAFIFVRNPVDVIVSQFMLVTTVTHTHSMKNDFPVEFADEWNDHVATSIRLWVDYHKYWLDVLKEKKIPVIFLRFEDLLANQYAILEELFEFVLGVESIKGLYVEERLKKVLDADPSKNGAYAPRSGKERGSNFRHFSKEQIQ